MVMLPYGPRTTTGARGSYRPNGLPAVSERMPEVFLDRGGERMPFIGCDLRQMEPPTGTYAEICLKAVREIRRPDYGTSCFARPARSRARAGMGRACMASRDFNSAGLDHGAGNDPP